MRRVVRSDCVGECVVDLYDESIKICIDLFRFGVVIASEIERDGRLTVGEGQKFVLLDWTRLLRKFTFAESSNSSRLNSSNALVQLQQTTDRAQMLLEIEKEPMSSSHAHESPRWMSEEFFFMKSIALFQPLVRAVR
jgi:hypothetical protein